LPRKNAQRDCTDQPIKLESIPSFDRDVHMLRLLLIVVTASASVGCSHRPFLMRGAVNVNGNMDMTGDMKMAGDMSIKTSNTASRLAGVVVSGGPDAEQKIAVIDVDGLMIDKNITGMGSMGENPVALFREKINATAADTTIAAVVLRINSPGGGVTASDIMCHELSRLRQNRDIPVVACLMVVGTGGGYYLATQADAIIAHPTTVVGGIGVILNKYNLEDTMGQFNILSMPIKAGEKIDAVSPERPMDDEEEAMLQRIADSFHERFIDQVKQRRHLNDDQNDLFDGRIFTGVEAKEQHLVDEIGYIDDAIAMAKRMSGAGPDAAVIMFRRDNDRAYTELDVTPNSPFQASLLPFKVPGLERSALPTFLYLWQPDPSLAAPIGG